MTTTTLSSIKTAVSDDLAGLMDRMAKTWHILNNARQDGVISKRTMDLFAALETAYDAVNDSVSEDFATVDAQAETAEEDWTAVLKDFEDEDEAAAVEAFGAISGPIDAILADIEIDYGHEEEEAYEPRHEYDDEDYDPFEDDENYGDYLAWLYA